MKKGLIFPLFLFALRVFSQEVDSVKSSPIRPAVYFDYGKAAGSVFPDNLKVEGGFELMFFNRVQTVLEMGKWDMRQASAIENGDYTVNGIYSRIGVGYLPYVDTESRIGIGFRYATANYSDQGEYTIRTPSGLQPDIKESFKRSTMTATWYEVVFYSDKEISKWLVLGFNFRVRLMKSYDRATLPDVMTIPGYGRAQDKSVPAFNLFLKIQPF